MTSRGLNTTWRLTRTRTMLCHCCLFLEHRGNGREGGLEADEGNGPAAPRKLEHRAIMSAVVFLVSS